MNTTSDPAHCGSCGTACATGARCIDGRCASCAISHSISGVYGLGLEPKHPVLGDLDRDGALDIVVPNQASGTVSVLLGEGDGRFRRADDASIMEKPRAALLGDLNRDDVLDLVALGETRLHFALGAGDGTFFLPKSSTHTLAATNQLLVSGDIDEDGWTDVLVSGNPAEGEAATTVLVAFLGDAKRGLGPATEVLRLSYPIADLQLVEGSSGHLDIVVGHLGTAERLPGAGDGTFGPPELLCDSGYLTVDLTGDGLRDFVRSQGTTIDVAIATAGGGCRALPRYGPDRSYSDYHQMVAGDVTGDGIPDLVARNEGYSYTIVLPGAGDGTFGEPSFVPVMGEAPSGQALGDLDGDGTLDLVTVGGGGPGENPPGVATILLNKGNGVFAGPSHIPTSLPSGRAAAGDLDGDGRPELVTISGTFATARITILEDSRFGFAEQFYRNISPGQYHLELVDLNGDGRLDVLTAGEDAINALLGDGALALGTPFSIAVAGHVRSLRAGDVSSDGVPDAVVALPDSVSVFLGDGTGALRAGSTIDERVSSASLGDLDGDGDLDLVLGGLTDSAGESGVGVCLGAGDGTFGPARRFAADGREGAPVLGDVDRDGLLDVVVGGVIGFSVLLGDGHGALKRHVASPADDVRVVLGDVTGDGILDVVAGAASLELHTGRGDGTFAAPTRYPVYGQPVVADYNTDGIVDIMVADWNAGVWLLGGRKRCE